MHTTFENRSITPKTKSRECLVFFSALSVTIYYLTVPLPPPPISPPSHGPVFVVRLVVPVIHTLTLILTIFHFLRFIHVFVVSPTPNYSYSDDENLIKNLLFFPPAYVRRWNTFIHSSLRCHQLTLKWYTRQHRYLYRKMEKFEINKSTFSTNKKNQFRSRKYPTTLNDYYWSIKSFCYCFSPVECDVNGFSNECNVLKCVTCECTEHFG